MIVRFARPQRHNALGGTLTRDLLLAFDEAKEDDSVRLVVTSGEEAAAVGLADRAVDASRVLETAMDLARELADLPPVAMQLTKRALRAASYSTLEEQLRLEYQNQLVAFGSGEPQTAAEALHG